MTPLAPTAEQARMHKTLFVLSAAVIFVSTSPESKAATQFILPPVDAPARGVVTPLIQLSPAGTFDMFATDLRHSLQEGLVPDASIFWRFSQVYDKRHYDLYPDFLRIALDHYRKSVADYGYKAQQLGLAPHQLQLVDNIARTTTEQVEKMIADAKVSLRERLYNEQKNFDAQIAVARNQIAVYKGNPATLTMPAALFPRFSPGDAAPRAQHGWGSNIHSLATQQLARVGDRLGSGTARSNQWLLLLRHHDQRVLNYEAAIRSFSPQSYEVRSISRN